MTALRGIGHALAISGSMGWQILWALYRKAVFRYEKKTE